MADGHEDYAAIACFTWCAGLGHSFAARTYQELIDNGVSPLNASLRVSWLRGHERPASFDNLPRTPLIDPQPRRGYDGNMILSARRKEDLILKDFLYSWFTTFKVHEVCSRTMELYYYSERHHIVPALGNADSDV